MLWELTTVPCVLLELKRLLSIFSSSAPSLTPYAKLGLITLGQGDRLYLISQAKAHLRKAMFMEVFSTDAWGVWKDRNNLCFNGINPEISSWTSRFKEDFALLVHRTKSEHHPFITSIVQSL